MNGCVVLDEWMDGWMDRRINGCVGRVNGWMN